MNKSLQRLKSSKYLGWGLLVVLSLAIAVILGILSFGFTRRLAFSRGGLSAGGQPQFLESERTPLLNAQGTPLPENPSAPRIEPTLTPWDGAGRVTILLMGLDYRDWEAANEYSRSDTMILLTLDPVGRTAGILSIPRDMWVAIPGFQHGKINTAYYLGDAYKLPGGGPGLAVKTVEQFLGVPINYYAQIDFPAFVRFIDELGGVKINVPEPITIDLLGAGSATKKTLQAGVQVLPGEWALAYARARYTSGGDFDRARRQQQVIMAIRDRVLSLDMLPTLAEKADVLYQELSAGIHTNLPIDQAIKLAVIASQVPENNIQRQVIGEKTVIFGRSPDNLSILIPIIDKIHLIRDELFASTGVLGPLTPGSSQERMMAEAVRIWVQDGSRTQGLGERTAEYLRSLGVTVTEVGAADQAYQNTTIVDHSGNPHTISYLVELMQLNSVSVIYDENQNSPVDLELRLGNDWAGSNRMP